MEIRRKELEFRLRIWIQKKRSLDIHLDIGVGLGSKIKFRSRDLDFNEIPILKWFKPFLNRKYGIWSEDSSSNQQL
jgi:hypothetical protein